MYAAGYADAFNRPAKFAASGSRLCFAPRFATPPASSSQGDATAARLCGIAALRCCTANLFFLLLFPKSGILAANAPLLCTRILNLHWTPTWSLKSERVLQSRRVNVIVTCIILDRLPKQQCSHRRAATRPEDQGGNQIECRANLPGLAKRYHDHRAHTLFQDPMGLLTWESQKVLYIERWNI